MSSAARSTAAPDIPTIAESGVPGYEVTNWVGIVAPRATPENQLDRMGRAIAAAVRSETAASALLAQGITPCGGPPDQFAAFMASEIERWRPVVARIQRAAEA